ncbi:uncharacterized protein [Oscarella lobularis]|uniref:uncharacterized protein n=1 Tax=Oscarella lobularis TaxID=121494 RepID=UPI00331319CF
MSAGIAVLILIAFAAEWRESDANPSVQLLVNRTRCLSNCYAYSSKASSNYPYVCKSLPCSLCLSTCDIETVFDNSFEKCKSTCLGSIAAKAACSRACEFINSTKTDKTVHETSDYPRKIVVTTVENGTLKWEQKNGVFYAGSSKSKRLAVLYLVLKAEVDPSNYNPENEAQFHWTFAAITKSKAMSFDVLRTPSTIQCNEHYTFKVAAVNKYGLRSYGPITQIISSEELSVSDCLTWCHPRDCSVPDYCGNHNRTSPLKLGPLDRKDLYTWNANCFSPEASRVIEWNPLDVNFTGDYCYSLYLVASYCTEMADRVYFFRKNESSFVLDQLKPDCKIYIFMIAGSRKAALSDYDQKYELVLKTPDPFSDRSFCCSGDTWFQASEITFNVTTRKYESTLSWRNPPRVPVDRFELIVLFHKKKNSFGRVGEPISVKAKDGTGLIYARDLEFDPGRVYSVTLQPIHSSNGYQSSAVTIIAQGARLNAVTVWNDSQNKIVTIDCASQWIFVNSAILACRTSHCKSSNSSIDVVVRTACQYRRYCRLVASNVTFETNCTGEMSLNISYECVSGLKSTVPPSVPFHADKSSARLHSLSHICQPSPSANSPSAVSPSAVSPFALRPSALSPTTANSLSSVVTLSSLPLRPSAAVNSTTVQDDAFLVGTGVGCVFAVAIVAVFFFYWYWKKKREPATSSNRNEVQMSTNFSSFGKNKMLPAIPPPNQEVCCSEIDCNTPLDAVNTEGEHFCPPLHQPESSFTTTSTSPLWEPAKTEETLCDQSIYRSQ